jgi:malate/lactate dehydrogenase
VRVAIVGGAGGAGASIAFNLLRGPIPLDVVVVDERQSMITSHAMDFEQVLEQMPGSSLRIGGPLEDADVIVVTASAPLTVNTSRLTYLAANARILDELADQLGTSWTGVVLVVTNPVDPLVTRLQQRMGIDRRRIVGYTINDSLRLRTGLAKAFGAPPGSVGAWVIGEHGDACVPLLDRVTVDGDARTPTDAEAAVALEYLHTWYTRHVALDSGRSSTWTTGLGAARMVTAIVEDADELWPASLVLEGEYGIRGVAVSVPVTLGRHGAEAVAEWELTPEQQRSLHESAEIVRRAVASLG